MFVIQGYEAKAQIRGQSEIDAVLRNLESAGYNAVLRNVLKSVSSSAGVPAPLQIGTLLPERSLYRLRAQERPVGGLLFFEDQAYLLQPVGPRLNAWEIRHHADASKLAAFCETVESGCRATLDGRRLRGMEFDWQPIRERTPRRIARGPLFEEAKLVTKRPVYSTEESARARLCVKPELRSFLLRLAQVGKARAVDAVPGVDHKITQPLLDRGLVRKEYLVICRQDSHTIATVEDHARLEANMGKEFRCSICGRPFREELTQEILVLAEEGKALLDSSHWMTIWITDLLVASGIDLEHIHWSAAAGEDEIDIVVDVSGPKLFLELKDREFGLGDAYPFAFRVARYGGDLGVVACTERLDEEAKKFLSEQQPGAGSAPISILEGESAIEENMASLVDGFSRFAVRAPVSEFSGSLGLNLVPILDAWMDAQNAAS